MKLVIFSLTLIHSYLNKIFEIQYILIVIIFCRGIHCGSKQQCDLQLCLFMCLCTVNQEMIQTSSDQGQGHHRQRCHHSHTLKI